MRVALIGGWSADFIRASGHARRAIREAEKAESRRRTPIVALTANALSHQVEEYLRAGMDGHVPKPIEIAKLYDAISRALNDAATSQAA